VHLAGPIILTKNVPQTMLTKTLHFFERDNENKFGVLRTSHLHQSIRNSYSFVSSELRHSYCAPLPLDATNIENSHLSTLKKVDSVLHWRRQESGTGEQRAFRTQIHTEPRIRPSTYTHKAFHHRGCIFKANSPGPSPLARENVDRVRAFLKSRP
jgi:hypothetical protein